MDMACVTGTPLHYLQPSTKGFPSGESLRKAETRFIAKVRDRQANFGQAWSDVMSFALMAEGHGRDISIVTHWEDAAAVSEREILENILLKKEIGLSTEQALREAGYASDEIRSAESSRRVPQAQREHSRRVLRRGRLRRGRPRPGGSGGRQDRPIRREFR